MLRNKIKGLLSMNGLKIEDYATQLGIHKFSASRKLRNNSVSIQDLMILADMTNTDICLVDRKTKVPIMTLSKDDLIDDDKTDVE